MGYVFISYSSKEQDTAKAMCALLKKNGIETWIAPDDIPPGKKYGAVINRAVKECSCFLLLLSDAAQQSSWVPKEVERAINYKKTIFTAKIEDVELNDEFEFYISTDQMVRIKTIDEDSKNIKKLIKSIIAYTGQKEKPETIKTPEPVKAIEKPKTGNTEKEPARAKKESTADKQISLIKRLPNGNIEFGHYEQKIGKISPIEWIVLEEEKNKMLVISKYALDCQRYNSEFVDVTWETCTLRKWLNEDFMRRAFTAEEQRMILNTEVTADPNPEYDTPQGRNTTDKVFLLSIKEAEKHFHIDEERSCEGTAYSYKQGVQKFDNGKCLWWLRSPGYFSNHAAYVNYGGFILHLGSYVNFSNIAVRPALWINLESNQLEKMGSVKPIEKPKIGNTEKEPAR
ncbi:MAG: toll/interleukin-1 receptor domain-containing protein, partial [Lachnospiraceae bacterium]|nr:toll/interleukin-1 receptor domain-containing protein [Lachnospiraceae bacterium]